MRNPLILLAVLGIFFTSCKKDNNDGQNSQLNEDLKDALISASDEVGLSHFMLPSHTDLDKIPSDPNNPITKEKVKLGMYLFHETGLSINPMKEISKGTYSCSSCHFASAGFQSGRIQGIGDGGIGFGINGEGRTKGVLYTGPEIDTQPLKNPSLMNTAYQKVNFWNGQFGATGPNENTQDKWKAGPTEANHLGFEGVETQAIAAIVGHRFGIDQQFLDDYPEYISYFDAAFPDRAVADRYTGITTGLAMAAYERTLLATEAPFQRWLRGDELAMTDLEKEGAILFFGKAECSSCHNGPALNKMEFHAIGMKDMNQNPEEVFRAGENDISYLGRGGFTENPADNYKFKTPQLYNLSENPYYGHGSSFRNIRDVVAYKNNGVAENPNVPVSQLAEDFSPLNLTDGEVDAIAAFIEGALRDPNLMRYQPESIPSNNCFPSNDPLDANELGCD